MLEPFSAEQNPDGRETDDESAVVRLTVDRVLEVLRQGEINEQGILPYSSNYNFLVTIAHDDVTLPAVYKPRRGESPLWDFPSGTLCLREAAAFEVSAALGWDLVPPTVLREGTRGVGSVQFFIDCDQSLHYFGLREDARFAEPLRQLVLFDAIINNADRKSGHCLYGYDQRLWAIDHGICFHTDYKLRTVIWEFSGEPIGEELMTSLIGLQEALNEPDSRLHRQLENLLSRQERAALCSRLARLLMQQTFPTPLPHQRNFPWPPV